MKRILLSICLVAAFSVQAQEATSNSDATSRSNSGALSGSISGATGNVILLEQNVPETQNINYRSSTTDTRRDDVHYSGTTTVKNVPGIAMSGPASGPCTGASGGIGLAGPGWGVGLNGAKVEPSCVVRENVRVIGMAMQSLDGAAHPQEKGELMIMMMDAARGLAAMNMLIINEHVKVAK